MPGHDFDGLIVFLRRMSSGGKGGNSREKKQVGKGIEYEITWNLQGIISKSVHLEQSACGDKRREMSKI